jgi:selenium-dependent xanthine dehydrogenase
MYTFTLNNKEVHAEADRGLLAFLREDLKLTATKNGCGSGACGACTVLVEGKPARACVLTVAKVAGKKVLTLEGLSERERGVYGFAFAEAGAVQCGFCIPGMVMAAKALLDSHPDPTDADIRTAIRPNICRCTGYVKIKDAIRMAATLLREEAPLPRRAFTGLLGEDMHRVDALKKTLGQGLYVDDLSVPGMLHASAVRSAHPRARVLKIDPSPALAHPDCVAVFTAADVPGHQKIGHLAFISDYDVMIPEGEVTHFVGDAVALVVCGKRESLEVVKALVHVDYEVLTPLTSPQAALAPDAPLIHEEIPQTGPMTGNILAHEHLLFGDAEKALASSAHTVTNHYSVPFTEHAFMEPECALAMPEGPDGVLLYAAGQSIYDEQRECSWMLGIPPDKVHVKGMLVGGGFGGKEDMSVQHHACLAAWLLKRPVKVLLSRQESIAIHPKRHAMEMDFTTGCDAEGRLTALKAVILTDPGA